MKFTGNDLGKILANFVLMRLEVYDRCPVCSAGRGDRRFLEHDQDCSLEWSEGALNLLMDEYTRLSLKEDYEY